MEEQQESRPELSERILEAIQEENPEALLLDGFEAALVGVARRCAQPTLAVYSISEILKILVERDGLDWEEAVEHFEFNIAGAWMGEHTPVLLADVSALDD